VDILHPPAPKVLYKYLKREHARRWLSMGEVRIGVLSAYRETERFGAEIGDPDEGTRVLFDNSTVDSERPETISEVVKNVVVGLGPGRHVKFEGIRFQNIHVHPDCYVLCLSTEFSEEAMRRMDPQYDACVRIDNASAFFAGITAELQRFEIVSDIVADHTCIYRDRNIDVHDEAAAEIPIFFLKDVRYAYQKEFRAVWKPRRADVAARARNVYSMFAAGECSPYFNCGEWRAAYPMPSRPPAR
jgi:hypothetical protein